MNWIPRSVVSPAMLLLRLPSGSVWLKKLNPTFMIPVIVRTAASARLMLLVTVPTKAAVPIRVLSTFLVTVPTTVMMAENALREHLRGTRNSRDPNQGCRVMVSRNIINGDRDTIVSDARTSRLRI